MLQNAVRFAAPPCEFMGIYNMGIDSVSLLAKSWFHYKKQKIYDKNNKDDIPVTKWFTPFGAVSNIMLVMGLIGVVFVGAVKWKEYGLPQFLVLVIVLWLANAGFSIFASPIDLRYQIFPIFVAFIVGAILIERIYQLARTE